MTTPNTICNDLRVVQELVYDNCGLDLTNLKHKEESAAYAACSFLLSGMKIQYRVSKITPTKTGQFVAIWKRNKNGVTEPFDVLDDFDFIVITAKSGINLGQFVFPKAVLVEKGIISSSGKEGKRGIRVYPPWDIVTSKQAEKSQSWQTKYFLTVNKDNTTDFALTKKLFTNKH